MRGKRAAREKGTSWRSQLWVIRSYQTLWLCWWDHFIFEFLYIVAHTIGE
ncbi:hypothetical protein HNR46_000909 [Haloferula luteola]|uniref:Uncharacterized protein n=1 Tax=Haloferula luteola TaxID=595692 RepID=A0A840VCV2_9BACT|nr:hypothetical protein [Haloferula luteola]